jgi:rsbT antagonist protein RsbS
MKKLIPDDRVPRVAMQIVQNCLVLSVQIELYDATLMQLRTDFLDNIRTSGVRRAIIDLSAIDVMDSHAFNSICDSANMAKVMGARTLVSGIRPGVASALVELGVDVRQVDTTLNLEDGFKRLTEQSERVEPDSGELPEVGEDAGAPLENFDVAESVSDDQSEIDGRERERSYEAIE